MEARFLVLKKPRDTFLFVWTNNPRNEVKIKEVMGKFAMNPSLDFSWDDAAKLCTLCKKPRLAS